jgi:uncharacterized protein with ACT and thioredoxin-like domain
LHFDVRNALHCISDCDRHWIRARKIQSRQLRLPFDSRLQNAIIVNASANLIAVALIQQSNVAGGQWNNGVDCADDRQKAGKSIVFAVAAAQNKIATVIASANAITIAFPHNNQTLQGGVE